MSNIISYTMILQQTFGTNVNMLYFWLHTRFGEYFVVAVF